MSDKRPVAQTFEEVRGLIHYFVEQFYYRYKLDKEKLVSAAYLGFMQAYDSYDPSIGEFSTWVGQKVNKRLLDEIRSHMNERKKKTLTGIEYLENFPKEESYKEFDPDPIIAKLSEDGKNVLVIVLLNPIDLRLLLKQLGHDTPDNWRQAIREYLQELKWSKDRIKKTFQEIRSAL